MKGNKWIKSVAVFIVGSGLLATFVGFGPNLYEWIKNEPPSVTWNVAPLEGDAPLSVVADTVATDPDNDTLEYSYYIDDALQFKGESSNFEFNLKEPNEYRLRVEVHDGDSEPVERVQLVRVSRPVLLINNNNLTGPLEIVAPEKNVQLPPKIITNGHSITLIANKIIGSSAEITSFELDKANNGANGNDGGPGVSGQNGTGANGASGGAGANGVAGRSGGLIRIEAKEIDLALSIKNHGQSGGDGGNGGAGGNGGVGGKGKASKSGIGALGIGNCDAGPVKIFAGSIVRLNVNTSGGIPGKIGLGGNKGTPGNGGAEGSPSRYCDPANRPGGTGQVGVDGADGALPVNSTFGQIEISIEEKEIPSVNGVLTYP